VVRPGLVTGVLGRVLLFVGVLILLFVAYQLWGTGIKESHSQAVLRQRFEALLHEDHAATTTTTAPGTTTSAPATTTTTTTSPASSTTSGASTSTTAAGGDQPTVGANLPAPGDGDPVGVLKIPKIGVNKVIVQGTSTGDLQQGPGHYPGTPLPGEAGNAAIAGHRTTYGAPFYNLNELGTGDTIEVTTVQGTFTYRVSGTQVVSPNDVAVVAATTTPELTLTTCNPRFSASTRLVVHAVLTDTPAPTITVPPPVTHTGRSTSPRPATQARGLAGGQGSWQPALWWGLLSAVVMALAYAWSRRYRRRRLRRWGVYALGGAASLVVLFFFFGAVSPLLPASF